MNKNIYISVLPGTMTLHPLSEGEKYFDFKSGGSK